MFNTLRDSDIVCKVDQQCSERISGVWIILTSFILFNIIILNACDNL